jgi:protocatechuate 3,4-dioxygenase beta subunit
MAVAGNEFQMKSLLNPASPNWMGINRRHFLYGLATLPALSLRADESTPSCVLSSEQEEGPYYIDGAVFRENVVEGRPGVPLRLRIVLVDARRCAPVADAAIDIWHCDASGIYSGFQRQSNEQARAPARGGRGPGGPGDAGFPGGFPPPPPPDGPDFRDGPPPPPPRGLNGRWPRSTDSSRFLRGIQLTNSQGIVEFNTIYPGWYAGRAIHIHMKVHVAGHVDATHYAAGHVSHTGQLFFPEEMTEKIAKLEPYARHLNVHRTTQEEDGIFRSQTGASAVLKLEKGSGGPAPESLVATAVIALDPQLTPPPVRMGLRGRGGSPPFPRE